MKAMLLAAGLGTRFRPQTLTTPKPALPFLNVPLGYYFFPFLKGIGVKSIVVNTFHLPKLIEKTYSAQSAFAVEYSHEAGKILGSGGGLGLAKKYFQDEADILLLNADEVLVPKNSHFLAEMIVQHKKNNAISTLLVMEHPEVGTKFGAVWVDSKKNVIGFGKSKPSGAVKGYHFPGVQVLSKEIFNFIENDKEQNILYDNLLAAQKKGHRIDIFEVSAHWYETGSLADYLKATHEVLNEIGKNNPEFSVIKDFLSQFAPNSIIEKRDSGILFLDSSAQLINAEIKNFAVLGKNSVVKSSKIDSCVFAQSTHTENVELKREFILY